MSKESLSVSGTMALHVTSWEWLSSQVKNASRDIEPCVRAITLERVIMKKYRGTALEDTWVGSLRRTLEIALAECVKSVMTMNADGTLRKTREWVWWDGMSAPESLKDPSAVVKSIEEANIQKQQEIAQRLALEKADREAITKVVQHVGNLACAKASSGSHAAMSSDVHDALSNLVYVSVIVIMDHVSSAMGTVSSAGCSDVCSCPRSQPLRERKIYLDSLSRGCNRSVRGGYVHQTDYYLQALELNSERLRRRHLANNDTLKFRESTLVPLKIKLPPSVSDEYTIVSHSIHLHM